MQGEEANSICDKKKKRFDGTFDGKIATEVARVLFFAVV